MPRKTSEIPMSTATFHTLEPLETPPQYASGLYRHITGIESETGLLAHPHLQLRGSTPITLEVPTDIVENAKQYFDNYYIKDVNRYRNCHIAAFAITHAIEVDWVDALAEANNVMEQHRIVDPARLALGARGVFGCFYNGEPFAIHSVVGVGEGLSIQTDREHGQLSLISTEHGLEYYQAGLRVPPEFPPLQTYSDY